MIKTWQQRCEDHPDHNGIVSDGMIQARMQEEIDELRAAIEQAQEPVAWMCSDESLMNKGYSRFSRNCEGAWNIPVYTAPSQRQWQGLTDEQIKAPIQKAMKNFGYDPDQYSLGHSATLHLQWLAKEIETKLRERNT